MKKEIVLKAMSNYNMVDKADATSAIEFVEMLLEEEVKEVEKEHPHATNTINRLKHAKEAVTSLYHDMYDVDIE